MVRDGVVAGGRFVRLADIARLVGDPDRVDHLGRVVVAEAPAGGDIVDLTRADLENRLTELGCRNEVRFAGAERVRIHAPGRISAFSVPADPIHSAPPPMRTMAAARRPAERPANSVDAPIIRAGDAENDSRQDSGDARQTARAWPAAVLGHRAAYASGGPAPAAPEASRNEVALRPTPPIAYGDAPLDRYPPARARKSREDIPVPVGSAAPLEYGREALRPAAMAAKAVEPSLPAKEAVLAALTDYFAASADAAGGNPIIRVRKWPDRLPEGIAWRVRGLASGKLWGMGRFHLDSLAGDVAPIMVEAETLLEGPVVMLRRAYAKDEIIQPSDVFVERRRIDPAMGLLGDPGQTANRAAARALAALRPLGAGDLARPLWVKAKSPVKVRAGDGSALWKIDAQGVALEDGRGGETIRVRGAAKGALWFVRMIGPGEGEFVGRAE